LTIEQLERVINSLADNGYIPGMTTIQEDEDHYLKVVQLKTHDISEDESKLISYSLKVDKITLADVLEKFGWNTEKCTQILDNLTTLGILKHSKSYLYGDQWYVVSERKN
jgi:predicted HTH transcriptional regulator